MNRVFAYQGVFEQFQYFTELQIRHLLDFARAFQMFYTIMISKKIETGSLKCEIKSAMFTSCNEWDDKDPLNVISISQQIFVNFNLLENPNFLMSFDSSVFYTWSGSLAVKGKKNQYLLLSLEKIHRFMFFTVFILFQLNELLSINKFEKKMGNTSLHWEYNLIFTSVQRKCTFYNAWTNFFSVLYRQK